MRGVTILQKYRNKAEIRIFETPLERYSELLFDPFRFHRVRTHEDEECCGPVDSFFDS